LSSRTQDDFRYSHRVKFGYSDAMRRQGLEGIRGLMGQGAGALCPFLFAPASPSLAGQNHKFSYKE
jgi:hypothetical protein